MATKHMPSQGPQGREQSKWLHSPLKREKVRLHSVLFSCCRSVHFFYANCTYSFCTCSCAKGYVAYFELCFRSHALCFSLM